MINVSCVLTGGQCAPMAGQVNSIKKEGSSMFHAWGCWIVYRKEEQKKAKLISAWGVVDQITLTCFCWGYVKATTDSQKATGTSSFVTENQNPILGGAALDVINERGTGANEETPRRPAGPKSGTQLYCLTASSKGLLGFYKFPKVSHQVFCFSFGAQDFILQCVQGDCFVSAPNIFV